MIADKQLELSNAQAVTSSAASTNQIDLGPNSYAGNSYGKHGGNPIIPTIDTDFAAAGAATLSISVRSSSNADMSGSKTHFTTGTVPVASLKRGANLRALGIALSIPEGADRYLDVFFNVATGPFTAGNITVGAVNDRPNNLGV